MGTTAEVHFASVALVHAYLPRSFGSPVVSLHLPEGTVAQVPSVADVFAFNPSTAMASFVLSVFMQLLVPRASHFPSVVVAQP